jgi:2-keto-4-pentenoate hydratase
VSAVAGSELEALAGALWIAQRDGGRVAAPSATLPQLELDGAYAIQRALVARRCAAGETPIGWKVGMSSAVGRTSGSPGPIFGRLLSGMVVPAGGALQRDRLHEPWVEGEIAVVMREALRGPGVTRAAVLAAAAGVRVAIEVFARRLESDASAVVDMVADNALSAHLALGDAVTPVDALDLRLTGLVLSRNDDIVGTGAGAQVLGDPALSVAWLANALAQHGEQLRRGDVVLTGAVAGAHAPSAGDVFTAELDRVGSVSVSFA